MAYQFIFFPENNKMLAGIYNPNHSRVVLIRIQKQGKHPHLPVCPVKTQNLTP